MPQNSLRPGTTSFDDARWPLLALYALPLVVLITGLLSEPFLRQADHWIAFTVGLLIFIALADRAARLQAQPSLFAVLLAGQAIVVLALIPLSGLYVITPMLTFIPVSLSQTRLPGRWANSFALALAIAVGVVYGLAAQAWQAALQSGLGYAAGYVFVIAFTRTAQREHEARQQLERTHQQLAEYAAQVERLATARERNRLAREVHDSLGHYLTVINVQLEVVTKLIESDPGRAQEAAQKAKALASEGLAEVRRSVAALRPSPLDDRPLPQVIRSLADDASASGLLVSFEQQGTARPLSPQAETVLYRTAQEALTNIRKHAHASAVEVRLAFEDQVRLRVRDNGVGRQDTQDDVGLMGLRERVAALDGTLRADNHPDGGFLIEVALPF